MINDFKEYNDNQRAMFALHGIEFFNEELHNDRKKYIKYCSGDFKNISEEKMKEMAILSLLEQLGYPMDEMGTYLYKNMIIRIANQIKETVNSKDIVDYKNLIIELKDGFSQFYLDVARNDLDIGLKTFHKYVETAIEKIDYTKADQGILYQVFGNINGEIDYGEQAFIIAAYAVGKKEQNKYGPQRTIQKVKKLINVPENN